MLLTSAGRHKNTLQDRIVHWLLEGLGKMLLLTVERRIRAGAGVAGGCFSLTVGCRSAMYGSCQAFTAGDSGTACTQTVSLITCLLHSWAPCSRGAVRNPRLHV